MNACVRWYLFTAGKAKAGAKIICWNDKQYYTKHYEIISDGITFIVVLFFYAQNYKLKISFYIGIN